MNRQDPVSTLSYRDGSSLAFLIPSTSRPINRYQTQYHSTLYQLCR